MATLVSEVRFQSSPSSNQVLLMHHDCPPSTASSMRATTVRRYPPEAVLKQCVHDSGGRPPVADARIAGGQVGPQEQR